ncbi:hypothetical protein MGE_01222 [Candida albicans P75010]|nr:hypothetical protein MGE_01222 [Candida albicans P75010]
MATMTEEITIHSTKLTNNNTWYYMNIEIVPQPDITFTDNNTRLEEFNKIKIDPSIWKSLIMKSMNKLYGLIGESIPFEILSQSTDEKNSIIIKIYKQDFERFSNGLFSFTFSLMDYYGIDINCYIKIEKSGQFLGLVI